MELDLRCKPGDRLRSDPHAYPQLGGVRFNDAQAKWQGSPYNFTGVVIKAPGAPSGNFIITAQSITYGVQAKAPCDSDVVVDRP